MLRDVSFPHLILFANILRKHLFLRKSKQQTFLKLFQKCSHFIALFKGCGSRQMCNFSFGFFVMTRPFTQSVGFFFSSMSRSTICLSSFSSFGLRTCKTLQTGVTTDLPLSFISIWCVLFTVAISPKNSQNSEKNVSLFISIWQILFISCKCLLVLNPKIGTESEIYNNK